MAEWRGYAYTLSRLLGVNYDAMSWFVAGDRSLSELYAFCLDYINGKREFYETDYDFANDFANYAAYRGVIRKTLPRSPKKTAK